LRGRRLLPARLGVRVAADQVFLPRELHPANLEDFLEVVLRVLLRQAVEEAREHFVPRGRRGRRDVPVLPGETELFPRFDVGEEEARLGLLVEVDRDVVRAAEHGVEADGIGPADLVHQVAGKDVGGVGHPGDPAARVSPPERRDERRGADDVADRAELYDEDTLGNPLVLVARTADLRAELVRGARDVPAEVPAVEFDVDGGGCGVPFHRSPAFQFSCRAGAARRFLILH
jgi:hypothetical protein